MLIIDVPAAPIAPQVIEVDPTQKPEVKPEPPKPTGKPAIVNYSVENDVQKLKFTFAKPVAAAVFERFGYYWLVFDTDEDANLPDSFKKSNLFASTKKIKAISDQTAIPDNFAPPPKNPLIFMLELNKAAYAMAQRTDNSWEVDFDPNIAYQQDKPLRLDDKGDTWEISAKNVTDKIIARDEITNSIINIYPLPDPGFIGEQTKNNSFILGKTVQGVTIQPISRIADKTDLKDKIQIIKPATTPTAATDKPTEVNVVSNQDSKPIFPFQKWPQLKGDDYRTAERKAKAGDREELAKFLFSQQLYPEAAVNLQGVPGFDASFLTGAAFYLSGHDDSAIKTFDSLTIPADVDPNELLLWKAAASHEYAQVKPRSATS